MHIYSVNNNKREHVIKIMVSITLLITFIITPGLSSLKNWIYKNLVQDADTEKTVSLIIESIISFCPSLSIYGILRWMYNEYLWKYFGWWHHIPDFNGKWSMKLYSGMKEDEREIEVIVKQNWIKLYVETKSPSGTSAISNNASIEVDNGKIRFRYAFIVRREYLFYEGFNTLEYDENSDELYGTYCSEKTFQESQLREMGIQEKKLIEKLQAGVGSKGKMVWKRKNV